MSIASYLNPLGIASKGSRMMGMYIDENGALRGVAFNTYMIKTVGDDVDFSGMTDGSYMFNNCDNLTSFSGDMPVLTDGSSMFYDCDNLTSFSGDLSALTTGTNMFAGCTSLTSFSGDLSALTNGDWMFSYCSRVESFTNDMPKLTNGNGMFYSCSGLTSFSGDLSALTNGKNMFYNCRWLILFSVDLPALTDGTNMFYGCELNETSILRILNTIPTYTSGTHALHLGRRTNFTYSTEVASKLGVSTPIAATSSLIYKGWTITITAY